MSCELIAMLQEESERLTGKVLPVELCRKILIQQGGLMSPLAIAFQSAKKIHVDRLMSWGINVLARSKAKYRMKINKGRLQKNAGTYTPRKYARDTELAKDNGQKLGDPRIWLTGWAVEEIQTHAEAMGDA